MANTGDIVSMTPKRVISAIKNEGLGILRSGPVWLYNNHLRPLLPITSTEYPQYNGVDVGGKRYEDESKQHLFDSIIWWDTPWRRDEPDYEQGTIRSLREHIEQDDDIVVIGGGVGASAVVSALCAPNGTVKVFEAAKQKVATCQNTFDINDVNERCEVKHALIGDALHVHSHLADAEIIDPRDLPECDVLELDCEGAKESILEHLEIRPRIIIVEVHTPRISRGSVEENLNGMGYHIVSRTDHSGELISDEQMETIWTTNNRPNTYILTAEK